jgi:ATP-binding cassette subfamily B protein
MDNRSPREAFEKLFEYIELEKKDITNLYVFAFVSGIISLSLPLGIQAIVSYLFAGEMSSSVFILIFVILLGVLVSGVLTYLSMVITERLQQKLFTRYTLQIANRFPQLDLSKAHKYFLPELTNRFFDVPSLQKSISKILLGFPVASLQIIFGLLLLAFYHPIFILFNIIIIGVIIIYFRFTFSKGFESSLVESEQKYNVAHWLEDIALSIHAIKVNATVQYVIERTDRLAFKYIKARKEHFKILANQFGIFVLFKMLTIASLLVAGTYLFLQQEINLGQLVATEIIIITLTNSVEKLFSMLETLYDVLTSFEKINKLTSLELEQEGTIDPGFATMQSVSLCLQQANLLYGTTKALVNIDLTINAGDRICILGAEGAGKSALLKVLGGAKRITSGNFLIEKIPYANLSKHALRLKTSELLNDIEIFKGSILENVVMGNFEIPFDRVLKACDQIGVLSFIQSLEQGFDTKLETTGKKLPRGIVMKLLMVRAVVDDPLLMVVEDFWSVLPPCDKVTIHDFLLSPVNKATLFVASNDVNFAKRFDKVILMDKGQIIANGSYGEVSVNPIFKSVYGV